jgi:hypothetical protein
MLKRPARPIRSTFEDTHPTLGPLSAILAPVPLPWFIVNLTSVHGQLPWPASRPPSGSRSSVAIDDKDVPLAPGMAVTIEIKTGQRRAIDYVPAPLRPPIGETMAAPPPSTARRYAHSGFFP